MINLANYRKIIPSILVQFAEQQVFLHFKSCLLHLYRVHSPFQPHLISSRHVFDASGIVIQNGVISSSVAFQPQSFGWYVKVLKSERFQINLNA